MNEVDGVIINSVTWNDEDAAIRLISKGVHKGIVKGCWKLCGIGLAISAVYAFGTLVYMAAEEKLRADAWTGKREETQE